MKTFKITYIDPETGESKDEIKEFEYTRGTHGYISAREWAEDYAYALADKGSYAVEEVTHDTETQ